MSTGPVPIDRDERTVAVENASYFWSYLFLTFGLLLIVAYRSFFLQEAPWDLLLLVVLAGGLSTAYQAYHRVLTSRFATQWFWISLVAMICAIAMALLMSVR